jgi:eukaryotic-like serine/threonine-protein kinase
MDQRVTLLQPDVRSHDGARVSSTLPPDLLEQVRGRLGLLALLMLVAFALDPLLFFGGWAARTLNGDSAPGDFLRDAAFYWSDVGVVVASLAIWWIARLRRIPTARLYVLGLLYEVTICFVIALRTFWEYYRDVGILPNLTWAPAVVILFPLILPAPPRTMLAAAFAAAGMPLLALYLLSSWGQISVDGAYYFNTAVSSVIAVGFAYMGSRVVYGLGRAVAAARELGSYHLEEKLGEGGMGEVWRARHRLLARPAAIKLIRPSLTRDGQSGVSQEALRRFEREAQVIADLRSPHTVNLFDFGVSHEGAFYYVMELLDGLDADQLVRRFGPVPAGRVVYVLRQVCHSLSEADSRGLVHRDIKPANVFLCRYGEEYDFVKLLDFGIVKAADEVAPSGTPETRENAVHGTPAFIAPEQAFGGAPLDGRADIYAAGCVAYWLLTGTLVFAADTAMGLLLHHAQTLPEAPSSRSELPIPAALDSLILSCLAKDPAARPQSARDLSRQLAGIEGLTMWTEVHAKEWWTKQFPAGTVA